MSLIAYSGEVTKGYGILMLIKKTEEMMVSKKIKLLGVAVVVLILLALSVYYFAIGQHAIKKTVVNGTNTNPVSYNDKDFLAKLKTMYPEVYSHFDKSGEQDHYIIPGLEQTQAIVHSGKNAGKVGISKDMDPQGMAVIEDKYLLISAYSKSKKYNSVIWLVDKKTGKYIKTIVLDDIDHQDKRMKKIIC